MPVHHGYSRHTHEYRGLQARHRHLFGHQAEIHLSRRDLLMYFARTHYLQRYLHVSGRSIERRDDARQKARAECRLTGDRQPPQSVGSQTTDSMLDDLETSEVLVYLPHQRDRFLGGNESTAYALEQPEIRHGLQTPDGLAHSRLRNAEQGRRFARASRVYDRPEHLNIPDSHNLRLLT